MNSFASLIDRLGSLTDTAVALGVKVQAVSNMKARNSVSPNHWPRLVEIAAAKGIEGITIETLSGWYPQRAEPKAVAA